MAHVAIILLNYNSTQYTTGCIRSLWRSKHPEDLYSILVWDNQSSVPPTKDELGECELVISKKNLGFAGGYNAAISYAMKTYKPEYLLILNNDTRVPTGLVRTLIEVSQEYHDHCVVCPKIYFEKNHEFHLDQYTQEERGKVIWYGGGNVDWDNILPFHRFVDEIDRGQLKTGSTEFVTGCCFLVTPAIWKKLRGFDEAYFMYYEDLEWSMRASKQRFPLIFCQEASLYHINAGSTAGSGSSIHEYYQTRNRLRFGMRYGKWRTKLALLKEAYILWKTGTPSKRLGVLHALEGRWGKQTSIATKQ